MPSLHFAVAPAASALPPVAGLELEVPLLEAVVVGATAIEAVPLEGTLDGGGVAAGADVPAAAEAFRTPP